MNVNELFNDVANFWDTISPVLYFHFFALLFLIFIAGIKISLRTRIENYQKSQNFARTKKILENFELWKKLPFILLIGMVLYLVVFNSVVSSLFSIPIKPITVTYSEFDFVEESSMQNEIIEIAKYSGDTSFAKVGYVDLGKLLNYREKFLAEQRVKNPDKYEKSVAWIAEKQSKNFRYYQFSILFFIICLAIFAQALFSDNYKRKFLYGLRFLISLAIAFFLIIVARYRYEQLVETKFLAENYFIISSLDADDSYRDKKITDQNLVLQLEKKIDDRIRIYERDSEYKKHQLFWLSRIVEKSPLLEDILGERKIHTRDYLKSKYEQLRPEPVPQVDSDTTQRIN